MADDIPIVVNSIPSNTQQSPTLTMVTFPSSLKLTPTNYLSWKTQIEAFLQGLDLFKFIDGSSLAPPLTVAADGTSTTNAAYNQWFHQDRLLFGALISSLSPTIVPLVSNAASSFEAWTILAKTYASTTRGRIKQLQHWLKTTTKTPDKSVSEFMQQIKIIVDELANLGKTMDPEDVTDIILSGLDHKTYKPIIDSIHARDQPISFHELHEKLINQELTLAQHTTPSPNIHQPLTAFAAQSQKPHKPWNTQSPNPPNSSAGLLPTPQSTHFNSPRPYLGKCQWKAKRSKPVTSDVSDKSLEMLFGFSPFVPHAY
ncbi:hypothetical protein E3N88_21800 [Mikania micrantha]|uniref:Retrotransposon Copia-like N-terminal domain-containing protein n=1 Tax=Mikania micrantha TaxID=192012 RepID=A0A5N6N9J3_9ASTR|nr:hypothetical protein E3N88_21800 [Mikania micrantha]